MGGVREGRKDGMGAMGGRERVGERRGGVEGEKGKVLRGRGGVRRS